MSIKIIKPGLLTTIQDCGRYGYQKEGIIVSGAMDKVALRIANLLVGNSEKEACIELTQAGPYILFEESTILAITGADLSPSIHNKPVPLWRPVFINKGSLLEFGKPQKGYRAYLAIAGGLAIPEVLGSYSTYLRARIGGWHGRPLQTGDQLFYRKSEKYLSVAKLNISKSAFAASKWTLSPNLLPNYESTPEIRTIKGPEYNLFTEQSKHSFWHSPFRISHQSDRMGYRLQGSILNLQTTKEMLSSAVTFGTVQVPANGNPIVLMADHQTTGGYPRIGQVASVDLPSLAQTPPGSSILFKEVSLAEAHQLYLDQERKIQMLKNALQFKTMSNLLL